MGLTRRVVVDLRAIQSRHHAERGIARYTNELAQTLEQLDPDLVTDYLFDPRYPVPVTARWAVASGKARPAHDIPPAFSAAGGVFLACSPFEDAPGLTSVVPEWALGPRWRMTAILYDLIPLRFADRYLEAPAAQMAYRSRLPVLTVADRLLAISDASRRDAVELLHVPEDRIEVIYAGVGTEYRPSEDREALRARLTGPDGQPGLESSWVLFTGGADYRKNVEGMIAGYAALPREVRAAHQLVVVCKLDADTRRRLEQLAADAGVADRVLFTGFVSDRRLIELTQAATVAAFPSRYEGFGLPVLEARACATAVVCGDNSSLVEVLPDVRARFDEEDPQAIAAVLGRVLADDAFRRELADQPIDHRFTWEAAATRTHRVVTELLDDLRRIRGDETAGIDLVVVAAGIGAAQRRELDEVGWPGGVTVLDGEDAADHLADHELVCGRADQIVHVLHHRSPRSAVELAARRGGVVVALDADLSAAYGVGQDPPDADAGRLVDAWYPHRYRHLEPGVADTGSAAALQAGIVMWADVANHAERLVTWHPLLADVIRLDTRADPLVVPTTVELVEQEKLGRVDLDRTVLPARWWTDVVAALGFAVRTDDVSV